MPAPAVADARRTHASAKPLTRGEEASASVEGSSSAAFVIELDDFDVAVELTVRLRLPDADRNELLCRNEPTIGAGQGVHDEKGFVVGIAPSVWGAAAAGLRPPPRVRLDGNYTSIKRVNSTHGHWGVMALWQMRGAYAD